MNQKSKISAIVVTFNEEKRIFECLQSLNFCDEIIVVDLGSKDNTLEIIDKFSVRLINGQHVKFGELAMISVLDFTKHDWVLSQDPDEVFPKSLISQVDFLLNNQDLAKIYLPIKYYFLNRPLNGTIWGGRRYKDRFFNKRKVNISPNVHREINILHNYYSVKIPFEKNNFIQHYWVDSIPQLFRKHLRYIVAEGETRYNEGQRFNLFAFLSSTIRAFIDNLIKFKGLKDGVFGFFLSLFYSWYVGMCYLSLLVYQISTSIKNWKQ